MIYEFIRPLTCPFEKIEKYVPKKGKILDVGCGHGLFAKMLAKKSKKREVLGIDPSNEKIANAKKEPLPKNLKFKKALLENIKGKFDCITVVDVLYLFPDVEKRKFFRNCKKHLFKNGKLLLVENGFGKELIFRILKIQETFMTEYLKFTFTKYNGVNFLDRLGYEKLLKDEGFKIVIKRNLKSILPYPHFLLVAEVK